MTHPLPDVGTWKHILDAKTGHVYFWDIDSGSVLWNLPGMDSHHKVSKKNFRKKEEKTKPAPMPTEVDFAMAHKVFKDQARRAVHCVEQQILRQKVLWEHEWHMELLDYTKELKQELAELAKNNPLVNAASATAAAGSPPAAAAATVKIDEKHDETTWSSERATTSTLEASMLKSTEDRAFDAAQKGRRNSETSLAQMHQARAERHEALMKKLAGRRKRQLEKLQIKQKKHDIVVVKLKRALAYNTGRHGQLMKAMSEKLLMNQIEKKESQTNIDITMGWVMLFDSQSYEQSMQMSPDNVYFWHPEHGSQWARPDAMEFDMQLKHVFGHTAEATKFAGALEAVDTKRGSDHVAQATSIVVEKWMVRHNLKQLQHQDSQLEMEVMRLEDELANLRLDKFGDHDATKDGIQYA
jgi:hypothetical protein